MKKLFLYVFLGMLWCNTSYAGLGDKTIVLKCMSMEQTSVPYKFKIFTHKKKGTRAITYKLPHEGNVKLWDGEILANSFVSDKGEKIYYWIKYYALPKPVIAAFGFNTSTKNQINMTAFYNISDYESNLRDIRKKAFRNDYDRNNQTKANEKHMDYLIAKEEVFNKLLESNKKRDEMTFACEED